jgi:hypothetical protein
MPEPEVVASSADAPSEPTETVTPAETKETAQPAEPVLYELPDGRKVDGETLGKEWKENFLPDYTRKSQTLAEIERNKVTSTETPQSKYADPNYAPQTYEEILQEAEMRAVRAVEAKEQARISERQAIENEVVNQLSEVKKLDPSVNENELFLHATKYGFQNLVKAHANMKDMRDVMKKVQTTTAANIAKRTDPVSVSPGATGQRPDPSQFSSALDYLKSIQR